MQFCAKLQQNFVLSIFFSNFVAHIIASWNNTHNIVYTRTHELVVENGNRNRI